MVYIRDIGQGQTEAPTIAGINKGVINSNTLDIKKLLKNQTKQGADADAGKGSLVDMNGLQSFYTPKSEEDQTLIFESRFESGNLHCAHKVSDNEYNLLLQNDVNTSGHTQWFFFRVENTKKELKVRFNMLNLAKPDSLFNNGMKPLIYSEEKARNENIGWFRDGFDIGYYANGIKRENIKNYKSYYTLTFTYEFPYDKDTVYFAY